MWICETVAYFEGVGVLKRSCGRNCCSLRRLLSLGRVKESKESKVLRFQDLKIPRSQDCVDLRDCRIFRGGGDVETASPRPRARVYDAMMLFCETVAYSERVGMLKRPSER